MGFRRVAASLALASVTAAVFAGSAHAQDFSADFTTDTEGFSLFEVNSNGSFFSSTLDHSNTGGNPGGFVRWSDLDSGAEERLAWFVPPVSEVPVDSRWIGRASCRERVLDHV